MNNYYKEHSKEYIESTFSCDMSKQYMLFEKYVKPGTILDLGCGSGRDSIYFLNKGYNVYSLDPEKDFCEHITSLGIKNVYQIKAQDMRFKSKFDSIWACASLLHISYEELGDVLNKCYLALKDNGIMYMSFKYGEFEGIRDGKYYCDMTESRIQRLLDVTKFQLVELNITDDVKSRLGTKWINIIIKK